MEQAGRLARLGAAPGGFGERLGEDPIEARVARQAEDVVDAVRLAPRHQRLAGKAAVGAQDDAHFLPLLADLRHDAGNRLDRAGAGVDVRAAQLGQQQVPAAEHIERQIAVIVIIAVKEPPLLMPEERDVGGVEIEHDLAGRARMRIQKQIDQEPLDAGLIVVDPVVLGGMPLRRVLQAVQRALPGDRRAVRTKRRQLAGERGEGRVMTQFVVVVQILVAERQGEDALPDQRLDPMFDKARVAPVEEASGRCSR
jgi:hypothetical protein